MQEEIINRKYKWSANPGDKVDEFWKHALWKKAS